MIPDHPIVQNTERTGYPTGRAPAEPRCPICGEDCRIIYRDFHGEYVGCDNCVSEIYAQEVEACFPESE